MFVFVFLDLDGPHDLFFLAQPTRRAVTFYDGGGSGGRDLDPLFRRNGLGAGMSAAALEVSDLFVNFGPTPAIMGLSAEIPLGSLTAVVGPNGAGKSTLLKAVVGQLRPASGRVSFGSLKRSEVAYLPQHSTIERDFPITVLEIVTMGLWNEIGPFGAPNRRQRDEVERAIAAVGMTGLEDRAIGQLSGGQLQRALFARLLLQKGRLILLDEPFSAVDAKTLKDLLGVIKEWHTGGTTVLAVLHDQDTVSAHFPETLLMARELVAHGPTRQVLTGENTELANRMCEACADDEHTCSKAA